LSISDRVIGWIFSDISLCFVLPLIFGVLIIAFPTVIADVLRTIHIFLPEFLWGGTEIPLEYILTFGITQGLLSCGIPIFLGLAWNKWAGGASGFLLSVLYTVGMAAYWGEFFVATVDWLGLIVSGMLAGYIAGALMARSRMLGNISLKRMLIWSIVAAIVAIVFTTQTYIWYSPMFKMSTQPPIGTNPEGLTYIDSVTYNYFINTVIYGVWSILGVIVAKVASWFGIPKMPETT